jgi:hypothetical protein
VRVSLKIFVEKSKRNRNFVVRISKIYLIFCVLIFIPFFAFFITFVYYQTNLFLLISFKSTSFHPSPKKNTTLIHALFLISSAQRPKCCDMQMQSYDCFESVKNYFPDPPDSVSVFAADKKIQIILLISWKLNKWSHVALSRIHKKFLFTSFSHL